LDYVWQKQFFAYFGVIELFSSLLQYYHSFLHAGKTAQQKLLINAINRWFCRDAIPSHAITKYL